MPDDAEEIRALADRLWSLVEWLAVEQFEGDELRCSASLPTAQVQTGEEPAGSWHQQKNGGGRRWAAVSGEIG